MKLDYIFSIMDKVPVSMKRSLVDVPFAPQPAAQVGEGSVMAQVKKRDILLSYPYESMDPFLKLIKEASTDPDVMTIKITIYRLAKKTRLVEYLCAAGRKWKRSDRSDRAAGPGLMSRIILNGQNGWKRPAAGYFMGLTDIKYIPKFV